MRKYPPHSSSPVCYGCFERTKEVHIDLHRWFWGKVKPKHPDAHVSWGFRDKVSQEKAVKEGSSKAPWPKSPHNHQELDPKTGLAIPRSLALDLFQINGEYPKGKWDPHWCVRVYEEAEFLRVPVRWGGNFKGIKDATHFEHSGFVLKGTVWIPIE